MKKGRGGIEYDNLAIGAGPGSVVSVRYDLFLNRGDKVPSNVVCSFQLGQRPPRA